jgi:Protein of unknown function (DUF3141)
VAQTVPAAIPLQVPTPPRALEGLSGEMVKLAPTAFNEYARDFWQRSVLFLDILRQRGNQREEMLAHGATSVLIYDSELVMRGDELPHPVNCSSNRLLHASLRGSLGIITRPRLRRAEHNLVLGAIIR